MVGNYALALIVIGNYALALIATDRLHVFEHILFC